jgi:hypothetical protein
MYHITEYTKSKAHQLGLEVKPSTHKGKKIDVFKKGEKIASIGALGMMDYPTYTKTKGKEFADERKRLYHIRHPKNSLGEKLAKALLW